MKPKCVTIQMKAIEENLHAILFTKQYKEGPDLKSGQAEYSYFYANFRLKIFL